MKPAQSTNYTGSCIAINNIHSLFGGLQNNKCQLDYELLQQLVIVFYYLTLRMQH
jgi:hypothetical protein